MGAGSRRWDKTPSLAAPRAGVGALRGWTDSNEAALPQPNSRLGQALAITRVASGNFLEMYDFMVFGYFATDIGRAFFPGGDSFAALMKSLMTMPL